MCGIRPLLSTLDESERVAYSLRRINGSHLIVTLIFVYSALVISCATITAPDPNEVRWGGRIFIVGFEDVEAKDRVSVGYGIDLENGNKNVEDVKVLAFFPDGRSIEAQEVIKKDNRYFTTIIADIPRDKVAEISEEIIFRVLWKENGKQRSEIFLIGLGGKGSA